ncbi:hypothetical protein [Paraliomyxa miuraensis]|uniref:hypothetical protein n=1 Tax=Paraliomyxa miuraensis TaxID=376150 RepID=UPI00224C9A3C|nr:hypothetical protein [Paraliomyxa miuraensis]MCX4245065.1 hypothetical protein [Paraliomyxa miuraensis]
MRGCAIAVLVGAALGWSCGTPGFRCSDDAQCVNGSEQGVCQASQTCTFPDETCPSGQRYGDDVGNGLAGTCFEGDGTSGEATSGSTGSSGSSGADGASTEPRPEDTTAASSAGSSGGEPGSSSSGSVDGDPYDDCSDVDDCPYEYGDCIDLGFSSVCTPGCETNEQCPRPLDSSIEPACVLGSGHPSPGVCVLPCNDDDQCPWGMECDSDGGDDFGTPICAWD